MGRENFKYLLQMNKIFPRITFSPIHKSLPFQFVNYFLSNSQITSSSIHKSLFLIRNKLFLIIPQRRIRSLRVSSVCPPFGRNRGSALCKCDIEKIVRRHYFIIRINSEANFRKGHWYLYVPYSLLRNFQTIRLCFYIRNMQW